MKIKVTKIEQQLPDVQGNNRQTGRSYTMKHWVCGVEINGMMKGNYEIKTFDTSQIIEAGQEYEVEEKTYNNIISYQIVKEKSGNSWGKQKTSYSLREYSLLFSHALLKIQGIEGLNQIQDPFQKWDIITRLTSTYIISAVNTGVKVPDNKQGENESPYPPISENIPF